jgi:DNA-binding CsgD family transcriptional regulator
MRDLTPVLDLFAAAESAGDRDAVRRCVVGALARLLPCEHVLWGELDLATLTPVAAVTSDGSSVDLAAFARHAAGHPLIAHHLATGDPGPLRLSDFASGRALRRLGVHADFYRPLGITHALCIALPGDATTGVGIAFHRAGRDFDEDERALLTRLRPAVASAVRAAPVLAPAELTAREAEVLRLVVRGATNAETALVLHISTRTVEKHLEHVYRKLRVAGRYAAMSSARSSSVSPWPASSPPSPASTSTQPSGAANGSASSRTRTATRTSPSPRSNATVPSPASTGV